MSKYENIVIPGGFDLLHKAHREFILSGIDHTIQTHNGFEKVTIALATDENLHRKGQDSPVFAYDWRKDDLLTWYNSTGLNYPFEVIETDFITLVKEAHLLQQDLTSLLVWSAGYKNTNMHHRLALLYGAVDFILEIPGTHTSEIKNQLKLLKSQSFCQTQEGAMLFRNGQVVSTAYRGNNKETVCNPCLDNSSDCFHAEQQCLEEAQAGDYLLTSYAPGENAVDKIIKKGVSRVVYWHNRDHQRSVSALQANGVKIRQVGLEKLRQKALE